ncbi:hypothetical protein [Microvirga brassicacearum]|uniref:Uncharacterized protein n=1 Tax=Microvirga brassicacearum TaxID=2580413 RepID=A0A5N3PDR3_9HYPH|nr:hypothetical protein [Microvirga brassicacearum]KAB0267869.1 hypothetical protein FEZ63_07610 [Microvirga brassicacearum]
MLRQHRAFTVEIKGRRKAGAFDWKSAFAAAENPQKLSRALPQVRTSRSEDNIPPNEPAPRRVLPALPQDELPSKPPVAETTAVIRPAPPVETTLPRAPALTSGAKRVAVAKLTSDRPVGNEAAESDRPQAAIPPPIDPIYRTRRIAAALSRAEKWKRRLPVVLR